LNPALGAETTTRRLDDGSEFQIVKRYYEPRRPQRRLTELGWRMEVRPTGQFFIYAAGFAVP
jgi:demethylmenaquinone methyltransferase/2-methoxy-6-polyprenyl-1,4-benzoquinol methylase